MQIKIVVVVVVDDDDDDAFSVQKKGQSPPPKTLPQAVEKVRFCKEVLTEYEN